MIKLIEQSMVAHWDMPAYTNYLGESYNYSDVAELVARMHIVFSEAGIRRGEHIAICGPNSSRWAIAFMAVVSYGAVVVPILNDFQPDQIKHIVEHSESRLLFAAPNIQKVINPQDMSGLLGILNMDDFSVYSASEALQKAVDHLEENYQKRYPDGLKRDQVKFEAEADENDLMMINYTSGTTGFSKGVMLTYRSLEGNLLGLREGILDKAKIKPGTNVLSILPMAHMYGLMCEFILQFCNGSHIFFLTRLPSPTIIQEAFKEIKPAIIVSVPLIVEKIVRKKIFPLVQTNRMRLLMNMPVISKKVKERILALVREEFGGNMYEILVGGAGLSKEIESFFTSINFPITVGYGTTETGPMITYADWTNFEPGSCGVRMSNMEVKIASEDPQNIAGEILTRGDNLMIGYYKNDEATKAVIDEEGWFHTGDLATMSEDGHVFIRGRIKNMLLGSNGQNIYPEEIEDKLNSMAMVNESLVIQKGEQLIGLVHPDFEEAQSMGFTTEELEGIMEQNRHELNQMLPPFCKISSIKLHRAEFEKTPKKSIKRYLYQDAV